MVDWLFLPQNFGPVVGTYEGLLQLCECTLGGGSIFRWWGHLTTIGGNRSFFLPQVVGTLKPSIISFHLSRPCLAPCLALVCLAPVSLPVSPLVCLTPVSPLSHSLSRPLFVSPLSRSLSRPLFVSPLSHSLSRPCLAVSLLVSPLVCLAPVSLPVSPLSRSLSHRCQVVGTLKPSIICLARCFTGVRWWGP